MEQRHKIIIAGGGTGGHIFPALAIANALEELNAGVELLFVGAKGKMEMEKIPQAGYPIVGLDISGFNRSSLFKNILLPYKLLRSFLQVRRIFKTFHPDAVVGVGGYSSFPVLRYAQSVGVPAFIHESNSFAGKSNMYLGKKATKIFVASEGMEPFFPASKIMVTGNPVRKNLLNISTSSAEARQYFGLNESKKTVLVTGGSLGAQSINNAIYHNLNGLIDSDVQLLWQTGASFAPHKKPGNALVQIRPFIAEMDKAFAAADVVVSRAGAMSVTEIIATGKPAVFVPYPHAAEDHQTANASYLVNKNAALMVNDSDVNQKLIPAVMTLLQNETLQQTFKQNLKPLVKTRVAESIAEEILKQMHDKS